MVVTHVGFEPMIPRLQGRHLIHGHRSPTLLQLKYNKEEEETLTSGVWIQNETKEVEFVPSN